MVGRYELTRAGIDLAALRPAPQDDAPLFALFVAAFTVPIFVFPLITPGASFEAPISAVAALALAAWAVDTLVLGGRTARTLSVARADRMRVAYHEAGHLLVGYLLGAVVEGYELPTVRAAWEGREAVGVRLEGGMDVYALAAVGLAGVAAEIVRFGKCEGGGEDYAMVGRGTQGNQGIIRWGMLVAVNLLREHEKAHEMACRAMLERKSLEEVIAEVEKWVDKSKLVPDV